MQRIPFTPDLIDSHCLVDVRTPLEFQEDHIPGAVNVPLLTNEERVEIGTIYKQIGAVEARRRGLELTCPRFYDMVDRILAAADGRPIAVYCWRGGLRSQSVAMLVESCGTPASQIVGGYKRFRAGVMAYFEQCDLPAPLVVLHGMTGTGKTLFLSRLAAAGWSTVDLEGIARHRGSAFGALGLSQDISQKRFETLLWDAFRRQPAGGPIVVEGESQRIGRYYLPGNLYQAMAGSCRVWCRASLATRVARLTDEYARPEYQPLMLEALERIRKKLAGPIHADLKRLVESWDVAGTARGLIEEYYDRMYYKNRTWTADLELDVEDLAVAEAELARFWRERG